MTSPAYPLAEFAAALMPTVARAGAAIMKVYAGDIAVQRKPDDSPLTLADLESQRIILDDLRKLTPAIPVLSEESAEVAWTERQRWQALWVVDPLDGTREFIKRNGEFTVNIALIVNHEPVLGLIGAPALGLLYWGAAGLGAFSRRNDEAEQALKVAPPQSPLRVVGSRSHPSAATATFMDRIGAHTLRGVGSSLKFCVIAEGNADLYPRFGPTSEWDTAAGQALLEAAGGNVTRLDGHRLRYNCRESLINSDFLAFGHASVLELPPGQP